MDRIKKVAEAAQEFLYDWNLVEDDITEILVEAQRRRIEFAERLGLRLDEKFRVHFEPTSVDRQIARKYQRLASYILKRPISLEEAILNRLADGSKLSRKIVRALGKLTKRWGEVMPDRKNEIVAIEVKVWDKIDAYIKTLTPATDRAQVLSTNILDVLKASVDCDWKSCFRPNGEYKYAPLIIAMHPWVFIAFGLDKEELEKGQEHKVWRLWLPILSEHAFQVGRIYGNIRDVELKGLRRFVELVLDRYSGGEMRMWSKKETHLSYVTLDDRSDLVFYDNVTEWYVKDVDSQERMRFINEYKDMAEDLLEQLEDYIPNSRPIATCEECGCNIYYYDDLCSDGETILCEYCYAHYYHTCECCNYFVRYSDAIETIDGFYLCSDCAGQYDICEDCGKVIPDADDARILHTKDGDKVVCVSCADEHWYCDRCGELYSGELVNIEDECICEKCAKEVEACEN